MRPLLLIILGLVIGVIATTQIGRILRMRDAYPRAVMVIMQHHMARMRAALDAGRCPADLARRQLGRIAAIDTEIVPAFSGNDGAIQAPFRGYAKRLQDTVQATLGQVTAGCSALATAVRQVDDRCSDCHQRYR